MLVVDDDALVRDSTAATLDDFGHAAVEAESARRALDIPRGGRAFDAVVTDRSMPGMSGARSAAAIAAEWPGLPVVLASGYAELPEGALAAVAERLTKPFKPGDLASALARATGSGGPGTWCRSGAKSRDGPERRLEARAPGVGEGGVPRATPRPRGSAEGPAPLIGRLTGGVLTRPPPGAARPAAQAQA